MIVDAKEPQREEVLSRRPLFAVVRDIIDRQGPIPFSEYMAYSNYGAYDLEGAFAPGFYTGDRVSIGSPTAAGNTERVSFGTSPEASPLFGITLAKQIVQMRELMGEEDFQILEVGGGTGKMAKDILLGLRFLDRDAYEAGNYQYTIIDKSRKLRAQQEEKLSGLPVNLVQGDARALPQDMSIRGLVITNELLDDLPTDCVMDFGDWEQEPVQWFVDNGRAWDFKPVFTQPTPEIQAFLERYNESVGLRPVSLDIESFVGEAARVLERGFMITIDYPSFGNLPYHALRNGADLAVFQQMGGNIWCSVDFKTLRGIGEHMGLETVGVESQSDFFRNVGSFDLLKAISDLSPEEAHAFGLPYVSGIDLGKIDQRGFSVLVQSKGMHGIEVAGMPRSGSGE